MKIDKNKILIFGLDEQNELASEIANKLGVELAKVTVKKFSDGEWYLRLLESARYKDCYIVHSTSTPVNDNLMLLMILVDALKRDSAKSITAIIPYFGYARQDRRNNNREPIVSKLVADLLATSGINHSIFMDIHAEQLQGFFSFPTDNLSATTLLLNRYIDDIIASNKTKKVLNEEFILVSPDYGGVKRIRALADSLNLNIAIVDKKRTNINEVEVGEILGDVKDKNCIVVDDIVDTAGTMVGACKLIKSRGAKSVTCIGTHPVLAGAAYERLTEAFNNKWIDKLYITNSISLKPKFRDIKQIVTVSLANLFSQLIEVDQTCCSNYYSICNDYQTSFVEKLARCQKVNNEHKRKYKK